MFLLTLLLGSTFVIASTTNPTSTCPPQYGARGVSVRLPPTFTAHRPHSPWAAPPPGWYFKHWSMIYASNAQYAAFRNLEYDPTPIDAPNLKGQVNDLFTFQLPSNDTVYTSYGIDTPNARYAGVLEYIGTGILEGATSEYSLLAWGCDGSRIPYYVSYSTATELTGTPAGIDIQSASDRGVDDATYRELVRKLQGLRNKEIGDLVGMLTRMTQDGARRGLSVVVCDDYCKSNRNLIGILG